MKQVLILLIVSLPFFSSAQSDTTYFDDDGNKVESRSAMYYSTTTKVADSIYKVEDFYMDGMPKMIAYFKTPEPRIKHGHCIYYDKEGTKKNEGDFRDGFQDGVWKEYYEHSDTLATLLYYNRGKEDSLVSYYKSGEIKRREAYIGNKRTLEKMYDEGGKEIEFIPYEEMPGRPFDIDEYLNANLNYPILASKRGIRGRVIVGFIIEEDGTISDVKIKKGVEKSLDAEALRVVKKMPKWKPAKKEGKPVKVHYLLPIVFRLGK